jgi:hypothetical protein
MIAAPSNETAGMRPHDFEGFNPLVEINWAEELATIAGNGYLPGLVRAKSERA